MAKNKPTKQHAVPQCYLREWVDPNTPTEQEPYVWIFNRNERKGRKKAPSNIFTETDLFTLKLKTGEKNYSIEETLSRLEGRYASIFRTKIKNHIPLSEEEHIILCAFVGAMLQRTQRHKDSIENFHDQLIERVESMEQAHKAEPKESKRLKESKVNAHKLSIFQTLPHITEILAQMNLAFLCAEGGTKFITSDDPCNLFNPDLQWQKFYSPGLAQKNVQVTVPLSPNIKLCLSWSNLRGYIRFEKDRVEDSNRLMRAQCYQYFVSHSPKTQRIWFRRYPMDFFFILKILKHKVIAVIDILKFKIRHVKKR
ncbi:DUF4238 domain-containing protein [Patescibacteria group bacterium]|nr:DUF4238 domain-containing protein [Patescibacteria group bacterium]